MNPSLMFILFFGTRTGKKREAPLPGVACPYCEQTGQLNATRFLAFVECAHCRKAYEGNDLSPQMQDALEQLQSN